MKELIIDFDAAKHSYGPRGWKTLLSGKEQTWRFDLGTEYTINWDRAFGRTNRNNDIFGRPYLEDYIRMQQDNVTVEIPPVDFNPYIGATTGGLNNWYYNYTPTGTIELTDPPRENQTYTIRFDDIGIQMPRWGTMY
jgi:hypothetical protein